MITILHVITDLEIGGAEMMLGKLLRRMNPLRYKNVVISLTGRGRLADGIEAAGVPVHSLEMKRAQIDLSALPKLVRLIKEIRPSILQTWLYHADLLGTAAAILSGRPHLVWNVRCSDMDLAHYPWTTRMTLKLLALCSRMPQAIIVNSQVGQRFHEQIGYRARRWEMIPNGFDLEEFRPDPAAYLAWRDKLRLPHDTILIGMVARVDPMKDHATFLEAARQVAVGRSDVAFVLVGKDVDRLDAQVNTLGLTGKVHLLGVRPDVATIMPALDIFSLTSAFGEGFPNVVGEAMACGVPCVVTDVGDAAFLVGNAGRAVPPGDPKLLARQWSDFIDMGRVKRLEMGAVSRERVRAGFNLHSVVNHYERCYEELVA
jgi:glycosyltransferase involved in cell wall biosynthesis